MLRGSASASTAAVLVTMIGLPASAQPVTPAAPASASAPAPQRAAPRPLPAPRAAVPDASPRPQIAAPFGSGALVEVTSSKELVKVFVARPAGPRGERPRDHDFVQVGRTPLALRLPPGTWLIEIESETVPRATAPIDVGSSDRKIRVTTGSAGMGELGTLMLGVGSALVLAGGVILVSFSESEAGIDKTKIAIPLFASGGTLAVGGLSLWLLSRSQIEDATPARATPAAAPGAGLRAGLSF